MRLVLAGAGHAHLIALDVLSGLPRRTKKRLDITLVSDGAYFFYSGLAAKVLSGEAPEALAQVMLGPLCRRVGATLVRVPVVRVDTAGKRLELADGSFLDADVASLNLGSGVTPPFAVDAAGLGQWLWPVKPLAFWSGLGRKLRQALAEGAAPRVLVAGGGPSGFEMACNVACMGKRELRPQVALVCPHGLLPGLGRRAQALALDRLRELGVEVLAGRVRSASPGLALIETQDGPGREAAFDHLVVATGLRPSPVPAASGLPLGPDGGMAVTRHLNVDGHPWLFGAGDCIHFTPRPLPKAGVYAVRQGPVLTRNLVRLVAGAELLPFEDLGPVFLALNAGAGQALACKWGLAARGRLLARIKQFFDMNFLNKFHLED